MGADSWDGSVWWFVTGSTLRTEHISSGDRDDMMACPGPHAVHGHHTLTGHTGVASTVEPFAGGSNLFHKLSGKAKAPGVASAPLDGRIHPRNARNSVDKSVGSGETPLIERVRAKPNT